MDVDPTVPVVKNMLLLDSEGKRIAVKYFSKDWCAKVDICMHDYHFLP